MIARAIALTRDGISALWSGSLSVRRQTVLTILTAAGAICTIALWWFESSTGLIADHDRYGYPFLLGVFAVALTGAKVQPEYRLYIELGTYVGIALYFIMALFSFVILQSASSIYIIANTLQWMPLVYIAAFVFFEQQYALFAGAGVFVASLVPPLAMAALQDAGFWDQTVAALLINAYAIHFLTLVALSLVTALHEKLRQTKRALAERDEALEGLRWETSERLRLEEQLRQSQRMEAIGQLTGGVAHDFNNLLTVVIGNADALVDDPSDPVRTAGLSRIILEAAERGADLTQKLLAFGRRQSLRPERVALPDVVDKTLPLLRRTLGEHIDIGVEVHGEEIWALADRTLLESAILNLALNARDAMPHGGELAILTGRRSAGPDEGEIPIGQEVVFLSVSDTGIGMAPEVAAKAFEPFFTTKEVGKGSGLGLSMVYGFARQSGGHASIRSAPGQGTTVTIVLRGVSPAQGASSPTAYASAPARGTEKVLLVEDEPEVLQLGSTHLVSLGYEVTAVSNGIDALELLERGQAIDLLLTDVVLPKGMSGVELARRARNLKPGLKVLLASGYSEDVFAHHGQPEEGTHLLRKPFRRQELAVVLREVLEGPPADVAGSR